MQFTDFIGDFEPTPIYRGGWVCRVICKGTDKSDYQIIHVNETPDDDRTMIEKLTYYKTTRSFKRNGLKIHQYRQQARDEKKMLCKERHVSNGNSWSKQNDGEGYYGW